jgi:hypothetical protein
MLMTCASMASGYENYDIYVTNEWKFSLHPATGLIQRFASCSHAYPELCIEVIHVCSATHPDLVRNTIGDGRGGLRPNALHYERE